MCSLHVGTYTCPCVRVCVRWGQQDVTTNWTGTALLLTKEASGCESGKPVAVILAPDFQAQARKLAAVLGENV